MTLLLHGAAMTNLYLVDDGELVPVPAVNARSAWDMAMAARYGSAQHTCPPTVPRVYQLDSQGELIAVFD